MSDRPIIFSAPMVRALLAGRKTQTRRLATSPLRRCRPGDRLYVRETFRFFADGDDCEVTYADGRRWQTGPCTGEVPDAALPGYFRLVDRARGAEGRAVNVPAIHMPRWASRLTLTVEDVRVEPLQAITDEDALAEGVPAVGGRYLDEHSRRWGSCTVAEYRALWSTLHTRDGERWQDNPEVIALTFRVERRNIDAPPTGEPDHE